MWKAFLIAVIGVLILLLQLQFRETYYPFHLEPDLPLPEAADSLEQLLAGDLDGNGIDDIFQVRAKTGANRYIVFSELGRSDLLAKGDGQKNYPLSTNITLCGIFPAEGNGQRALFIRESDTSSVSIKKYSYNSAPEVMCEYRKPRRCFGKTWHEPGLGVVGSYRDMEMSRNLLICRLDIPACDQQRRYFLLDPAHPSRLLSTYHMGAHIGSAILSDIDADDMPELFLFCGSTENNISANGTVDSCGYVIALDHNLQELWKSNLGTAVTLYGTISVHERGARLIAGLNHNRSEQPSTLYLFNPINGALLDSLVVKDGIAGIGSAEIQKGNGTLPILATNSHGAALSFDLTGDHLVPNRRRFGSTRTCILGAFKTANPPLVGILIGDRANGDVYIVDSRLRSLCRIESNTGIMPSQFYIINRTDGAERILYREKNGIFVSRLERASALHYAMMNFWGVIAYVLLIVSLATVRRTRKPDALEGKLKLLEHMRVSAFHGRLSLVKSIERLARLIEMIGRTELENQSLTHQYQTELRAFRSKWNDDLAAIIAISEQYGLYAGTSPGLRALQNEIRLILERSHGVIDENSIEASTQLIRHAEILKDASAKLADALALILTDLDKAISCDAIAVAKTSLDLFRAKETGIMYSLQAPADADLRIRMLERDLLTVMDNLLSNSTRAVEGSEKKAVEIVVSRTEHHATIVVRDTGCGIDPDTLPVLFNLGTTTKRSGGTGLYSVRKTIDRYGGTISARSEGLGAGAEISFNIPVALALIERAS